MPFSVEHIAGTRLNRASMSHLFTPDDAAAFMRAYTELLARSGARPDAFDLLVDVSDTPIQPGQVVSALTDFIRLPEHRPARIAFVHGDRPIKMQAKRVSGELGGRHFTTEEEAMRWLAPAS